MNSTLLDARCRLDVFATLVFMLVVIAIIDALLGCLP